MSSRSPLVSATAGSQIAGRSPRHARQSRTGIPRCLRRARPRRGLPRALRAPPTDPHELLAQLRPRSGLAPRRAGDRAGAAGGPRRPAPPARRRRRGNDGGRGIATRARPPRGRLPRGPVPHGGGGRRECGRARGRGPGDRVRVPGAFHRARQPADARAGPGAAPPVALDRPRNRARDPLHIADQPSGPKRLVADARGGYDYWDTGSRATLRELLVNEGAAVAAAQVAAPGFEPWEYFGYTRRQYRRCRELDAFLRRVAAPELDQRGLGLRLRFLSGGMGPGARLAA